MPGASWGDGITRGELPAGGRAGDSKIVERYWNPNARSRLTPGAMRGRPEVSVERKATGGAVASCLFLEENRKLLRCGPSSQFDPTRTSIAFSRPEEQMPKASVKCT